MSTYQHRTYKRTFSTHVARCRRRPHRTEYYCAHYYCSWCAVCAGMMGAGPRRYAAARVLYTFCGHVWVAPAARSVAPHRTEICVICRRPSSPFNTRSQFIIGRITIKSEPNRAKLFGINAGGRGMLIHVCVCVCDAAVLRPERAYCWRQRVQCAHTSMNAFVNDDERPCIMCDGAQRDCMRNNRIYARARAHKTCTIHIIGSTCVRTQCTRRYFVYCVCICVLLLLLL